MTKDTPAKGRLSRRSFLKITGAAGAAIAFPTIIPASALGRDGRPAPSERITMGIVGWGMQGPENTKEFMKLPEVQVVGTCNIDKEHLAKSVKVINDHYKKHVAKKYHDYRKMMARKDIDAVMIAVPDHWHELVSVEAARNHKDIYGEKPLAKTIAEQQRIVHAVREHGIIWQTGSWQRSSGSFHKAAEIVRNGLIGKITHVEVGLPSGHTDFAKTEKFNTISKPPHQLDYDRWIGPSKMEPYIKARVHMNWRWNYNTGGGQLMDWVGHHLDIAHWGLGFDLNGPYEVEGHAQFPAADAMWNTATEFRIEMKYPDNIRITLAGGDDDIKSGTKWIGTDGWVYVDRGKFDASNEDWMDIKELADDDAKIKLYHSTNHWKNFIDCVKSRQKTIAPAEVAHHSAIPGHLGYISSVVGRKLKWDVEKEQILDDSSATILMSRVYRSPYQDWDATSLAEA
jgi:predicted dehydrogenase